MDTLTEPQAAALSWLITGPRDEETRPRADVLDRLVAAGLAKRDGDDVTYTLEGAHALAGHTQVTAS